MLEVPPLPVSLIPDAVPAPPKRRRRAPDEVVAPAVVPVVDETPASVVDPPVDATAVDATAVDATAVDAPVVDAPVVDAVEADDEMETEDMDVVVDGEARAPIETVDLQDDDAPAALSSETLQATMSLKQLRDMCAARGLNTNGRKAELADRLAA